MAWLSAAPRPDAGPDKSLGAGEAPEPVTRLAQLKAEGIEPDMPDNPAPHLIDYLMEIGPIEPAGMDRAPIGWATIGAWQALTGTSLQPWEARLLRRLSAEFLGESRRAEKPDCPAPWSAAPTEQVRDVVDRKLAAIFGG